VQTRIFTRQPLKALAQLSFDKMKYLKILAIAIPLLALVFINGNQK
jgi:hypothetical protein